MIFRSLAFEVRPPQGMWRRLCANGDVPLDGSHFHDWIDNNAVAHFLDFWGEENLETRNTK